LLLVEADSESLVSLALSQPIAHLLGPFLPFFSEDLGIMKKSAIRVFKLLSQKPMEMRVEISETLLRMIKKQG
jgi:hypothetical protein